MLSILYFASIREKLGLSAEQLELPDGVCTVSALVDVLIAQHGPVWDDVLNKSSVLVAVNQTVAQPASRIKDGDEIAFFPPVTGG